MRIIQPARSLSAPTLLFFQYDHQLSNTRRLAQEEHSVRMIRAVDVAVTVAARATQHIGLVRAAEPTGETRAVRHAVALVTQPRPRHPQQVRVIRAMRPVAVQAVLTHRRVFPQPRAALLGMTRVAIFIDGSLAKQLFGRAAVRVMAVRASDLVFANWHVRRVLHLRALKLVALITNLGHDLFLQLMFARHRLHDRVAVGAGEPARLVIAAGPVSALTLLVTVEAEGISFVNRSRIVFAETHYAADAAPAAEPHVLRARPMAVLAFELALLGHADLAHQGLFELCDRRAMAGRALRGADIGSCYGRSTRLRRRRTGGRRGIRLIAVLKPAQEVEKGIGCG